MGRTTLPLFLKDNEECDSSPSLQLRSTRKHDFPCADRWSLIPKGESKSQSAIWATGKPRIAHGHYSKTKITPNFNRSKRPLKTLSLFLSQIIDLLSLFPFPLFLVFLHIYKEKPILNLAVSKLKPSTPNRKNQFQTNRCHTTNQGSTLHKLLNAFEQIKEKPNRNMKIQTIAKLNRKMNANLVNHVYEVSGSQQKSRDEERNKFYRNNDASDELGEWRLALGKRFIVSLSLLTSRLLVFYGSLPYASSHFYPGAPVFTFTLSVSRC